MKYAEFEQRVVDTYNRLICIDTCDDEFFRFAWDYDIDSVLLLAFKQIFHIDPKKHEVSRTELMCLFDDDLDKELPVALDSFNDIMDRYNVVPAELNKYCHLRIV